MNEERPDGFRESTEKLWHATRKTLQSATFRASQYRKVVQKKIDLASLHRKISQVHGQIGKCIDDFRQAGAADILDREEIQTFFRRLDGYKMEAAEIEEEIERLQKELPPREDAPPDPR